MTTTISVHDAEKLIKAMAIITRIDNLGHELTCLMRKVEDLHNSINKIKDDLNAASGSGTQVPPSTAV